MAILGNLNFNKNNIMQEITFRNDLNPSHCGYIWMKVTVVSNCTIVKYLHLYTVLQKISSHPLKVAGFGISILVGCPKRAVQKLFFRKFYDTIDYEYVCTWVYGKNLIILSSTCVACIIFPIFSSINFSRFFQR